MTANFKGSCLGLALVPLSLMFYTISLLLKPPNSTPFSDDVLASYFPKKMEIVRRDISQPPSTMLCLLTFQSKNCLKCFVKHVP